MAFCDPLQSFDRPTNELRYVIDSCQDFSIRIFVNKLEQLSVYDFYTCNFISVLVKNLVFTQNFIFFSNILLSEGLFQFISSLLKLLDQIIKAFVDVTSLLLVEPLDFLFDMLYKLSVVIIYPFCVYH